jgi:hypothetical protein
MRDLTYRGTHDGEVDTVPDPASEPPKDAIGRVTSSGVETDAIRLVDHQIEPGVSSDTIPAQAWTCWNKAPGPGDEEWLTTDEREWSITTGQTAALNLLAVARALQAHPIPAPSQS